MTEDKKNIKTIQLDNTGYSYFYKDVSEQDTLLYINKIAKALEKQIPMKPIQREKAIYYKCPKCGYALGSKEVCLTVKDEFCSHCGQHIDWSVGG